MIRALIIVALMVCSCWVNIHAQPLRGAAQYETQIKVAQQKLEEGDYYNALEWYEKAYETRQEESLIPIIADLHLKLRDYSSAQRMYSRVLRRDEEGKYTHLTADYGRAFKMYGKYDEAIEQFQKFLEFTDDPTEKQLIQNEIAGAELAKQMEDQKLKVEPERLDRSVNGGYSEYGPVWGRDGSLYFSTFQLGEEILDDVGYEGAYSRIFQVKEGERGWDDPLALDEIINRPEFHTSNPAFSADGNRMYFTRQTLSGNEVVTSQIYYSIGGDGAWGAANEVVGVNGEYLAKHPAVGELFGREVLFFSSDMEGGEGGFDLYYASSKGEGVYGDPVNLGPKINTPRDEITPFYFDGTLYFSSDGHVSMGGKDVFYTVWDGETWSTPKNMGPGFNTSQDDQHLSLDNTGYRGAMTSNRPGGRSVGGRTCCDDIYTFAIEKITADLVVGTFNAERKPLKGATVSLVNMQNGKPIGSPMAQTSQQGNRFDFGLDLDQAYKVVAKREGFYPDSVTFNTVGLEESKSFEHRFYLKPLPKPEPEPEYDTVTIEQAIVLENILYAFNRADILPEAETDLQVVLELMDQYPDMVIELGAHTDNRGNDEYNRNLSQRRAESARQWLVDRGVAPERVVAKGYGESQPKEVNQRIVDNNTFLRLGDVLTGEFIDELPTEEEQEAAHQINRRTEFRILEGPQTITIKRTRKVQKEGNDRKSLPALKMDSLKVSELSSLHGTEDLSGLPIMQFEERVIDFGLVKKGEKREYTYRFTNMGEAPLRISIVSACDCTTATYEEEPVLPGDKGEINIVFDSAEKEESEIIDIDIILENEDHRGVPIIERLQYSFELEN